MFVGNYGSWVIEKGRAFLKSSPEIEINLFPCKTGAIQEGWWGNPTQEKDLISGICIFDARWSLEFENGKEIGTKKSLSLPREREKAFKMIKKGRKIKSINVPDEIGKYHQKMIRWQVEKICQLSPKRILYHLPAGEYEIFIQELEAVSNKEMSRLYAILKKLSNKIKISFLENLNWHGIDTKKIEFINPLEMGARNTDDSFGLPYLFPHKLGMSPEDMMGIEDLVELRISLRAKKEMEYNIPVLCAVLQIPHPYMNRDDSDGGIVLIDVK